MSKANRARQIWLALHLQLGLWLGAAFALLGLSGSVLVFYLELDRWVNPQIAVRQASASTPSVQALLEQVRVQHPQHQGSWRFEMPLTPDTPVMARYYNPPERSGRMFAPLMLTFDPQSLELTSSRYWGDCAMTWLYNLHYTLLLEGSGHTLVGFLGLLMALSLLSGLYLWWPSAKRSWRALRPRLRPGRVLRTYDLHVLVSVYGGVVLLVLALSGSALALPHATQSLLALFSQPKPPLPVMQGLIADGEQVLDLDEAIKIAQARFPLAELRWIETPGIAGKPIAMRFHQAQEPGRRFPRTHVWLHPVSGRLLMVRDGAVNSGADTVLAWVHPLHNGEAFGAPGRWLACLAGVLPTILFVTGCLRWRQKCKARTQGTERRRHDAPVCSEHTA